MTASTDRQIRRSTRARPSSAATSANTTSTVRIAPDPNPMRANGVRLTRVFRRRVVPVGASQEVDQCAEGTEDRDDDDRREPARV